MSPTKLLKFNTYPTNFLFREFFKFEVNYIHPIKLPQFPKELQIDSSELHKGLERISNFAVSKYLIQDLTNINPKNILKSLVLTPQKMFVVISQARSNTFAKRF